MTNTKKASRRPKTNHSQTLNKHEKIIAFFYGLYKERGEQIMIDILMVVLGCITFSLMFVLGRLVCQIFGLC